MTPITSLDDLFAALIPEDGGTIEDCAGRAYRLPKSLPLARQVKVGRIFERVVKTPAVESLIAAMSDRPSDGVIAAAIRAAEARVAESEGEGRAAAEEVLATLRGASPSSTTLPQAVLGLLGDEETLQAVVEAFTVAHPAIAREALADAEPGSTVADVFAGEALVMDGLVPFLASAARRVLSGLGRVRVGPPTS